MTAELGQKCFCILIKNNNERSKKLFAGRVSRLLTRHTKLKKLINAVRKKVRKTKTISEIEIFAECLKSQLHGKEAKVIVGDCIYAWRKQRDLSKKILPGVSRTQKTLHEFELGVHDAINRSLLSKSTQSGTGLDEDLLEAAKNDFMLLKEYHAGYQHNFTVALMRIVARAFLSRTELENLASKNKQLANKSKKKLVEIYESLVKDLLFFTAYMCWRLSHGENPLSAQDAYWLGIIDEIKSVIPASQAVPVQKPMRRPSPRKKAAV